MSEILANVKQIETVDTLNIVTFDFFGNDLKMMSLELSGEVQVGVKALLGVKPTSVIIAKDLTGRISFSNKLQGKVVSIDTGGVLCNVKIKIANSIFESIITKQTSKNMDLNVEDEVTIFIKASELSIVEVYND